MRGDLNDDGTPDLVVSRPTFDTITVLLGDGTTGFEALPAIATGDDPQGMALGDLNGDDSLDLVVAHRSSSDVWIRLGDGTGGFGPAQIHGAGESPRDVDVGDLDGDGNLDLVVTNHTGDDLSLLFGDGTGDFGPQILFAVGESPRFIDMGDFDSDGALDVVVFYFGHPAAQFPAVFFGDGSGTFGSPIDLPVAYPGWMLVGDVDGTGSLDIVVSTLEEIIVFLNDGIGSFVPQAPLSTGPETHYLPRALGDFDGDGETDLFASGGVEGVGFSFGEGAGELGPLELTFTGYWAGTSASADFNGDGIDDLAVSDPLVDLLVTYLGDPSRELGTMALPTGLDPQDSVVRDFDGDGVFDIAVTCRDSDGVSVLYGLPEGGFDPAVMYCTGNDPRWMVSGDLNDDGADDLMVACSINLSVLLNDDRGGFDTLVTFPIANVGSLATGDLNGDGALDLVATRAGEVLFLPGTGFGIFF